MVQQHLQPDEERLHNSATKVLFDDGPPEDGFVFLTSRQFLFGNVGGMSGGHTFEEIEFADFRPPMNLVLGVRTPNSEPVKIEYSLYPSPISQALMFEMRDRLAIAHPDWEA
jgi:hypothetical protein